MSISIEDVVSDKPEKELKLIKSVDSLFTGKNFSHLQYEYCHNAVCLQSPHDYDCKYSCAKGDESQMDLSGSFDIRRAFIPQEGFVWVSIDYSQIELRVSANMAPEKNWIYAFLHDVDVHTQTAKALFRTETPTDYQRKLAKICNFAALYGGSAYTIAMQTGIATDVAEEVYNGWIRAVPGLMAWIKQMHQVARQYGHVKTSYGRKRDLTRWTNSDDRKERGYGDRSAVSHMVQGCQPAKARVLTNKGYIKIGDLFAKYGAKHSSLDPKINPIPDLKVWTGKRWAKFNVLSRGRAPLVDMTLSNGKVVHMDTRHKFFTHSGDFNQSVQVVSFEDVAQNATLYKPCMLSGTEYITFDSAESLGPLSFGSGMGEIPEKFMSQLWYLVGRFLDLGAQFTTVTQSRAPRAFMKALGIVADVGEVDEALTEEFFRAVFAWLGAEGFTLPEIAFRSSRAHRMSLVQGIEESEAFFVAKRKVEEGSELSILDALPEAFSGYSDLLDTVGRTLDWDSTGLSKRSNPNGYGLTQIRDISYLGIEEETYTLAVDDPDHSFIAQGMLHKNTAADIMKLAMIKVDKEIIKRGWEDDCRMLLTIHDEIDFEIRESKLAEIISVIRPIMELKRSDWPVPFLTDVEVAKNWGSVSKYDVVPSRFEKNITQEKGYPVLMIPRKLNQAEATRVVAILNEMPGPSKVRLQYEGGDLLLSVADYEEARKALRSTKLVL